MPDDAVERLLSLFTSAERAAAIAGDLVEERACHGSRWFWMHVARVACALWWSTATDAPLRVLALVLTGLALVTPPVFGGIAAIFLVPVLAEPPTGWILLASCWWTGALWTGASIVALAPRQGMAACGILAVQAAALSVSRVGQSVLFCTTGLLATMALLVGAAIARRRLAHVERAPWTPVQ